MAYATVQQTCRLRRMWDRLKNRPQVGLAAAVGAWFMEQGLDAMGITVAFPIFGYIFFAIGGLSFVIAMLYWLRPESKDAPVRQMPLWLPNDAKRPRFRLFMHELINTGHVRRAYFVLMNLYFQVMIVIGVFGNRQSFIGWGTAGLATAVLVAIILQWEFGDPYRHLRKRDK